MSAQDKKGQIVITDFFIGFGVFIVTAIIISVFLSIYQVNLSNNLEFNQRTLKAVYISESLTRTPGVPSNWSHGSVKLPGLVTTDRNLSFDKLDRLVNISMPALKSMFKASQYNMSIVARYTNETIIASISDVGTTFKTAVVSRGYVMYGGEPAYVEVRIVE